MDPGANDTKVEEPQVLPPETLTASERSRRSRRRAFDAFGPILAGVLVDAIDFSIHGPIGMMIGIFLAGTITYVLTTVYRLPVWQRLAWSVGAGLYCLFPRGRFIPLATIMGGAIQYWKSGD